ncbi:DL-methionine transporter ATP-binding subunit [Paenibacillus sp. P1XP2]|nr:DL-methionine transporter ATP-binding subunit [Paenibacillus sp. P1XP2]
MITFEHVEKIYASGEMKVHALKGVSLQIKPREFVSIMGRRGRGNPR